MDSTANGIILLDTGDVDEQVFDVSFLERNGHEVIVCNGPASQHLCPLLGGEGCPKFEAAHGIIVELDLDRPQHRAIVQRYRELGRPDLPIRVVVRPDQAAQFERELAGIETWPRSPNAADLDGFAAEVEAADRVAGV